MITTNFPVPFKINSDNNTTVLEINDAADENIKIKVGLDEQGKGYIEINGNGVPTIAIEDEYTNDAAAAAGGIDVGKLYNTPDGTIKMRKI